MVDHTKPLTGPELDAALQEIVEWEFVEAEAATGHIADPKAYRQAMLQRARRQARDDPWWASRRLVVIRTGKRITMCREVRGTHGISHEYHPLGTDARPEWWNMDEARALAERRRERARRLSGLLPDDDDA